MEHAEIEDDFDYFANRKPSKSLKSFVPGFNMKQKTKKSLGLDLRVKQSRSSAAKKPLADPLATTAAARGAQGGPKRALVRSKLSGKENQGHVGHRSARERKAKLESETIFIVDDDDDSDEGGVGADGGGGDRGVKSKPKRTFISDEDEPELASSVAASGRSRSLIVTEREDEDDEPSRGILQNRKVAFQPEPIDRARDPLVPMSKPKSSGSMEAPSRLPFSTDKMHDQRHDNGFDDDDDDDMTMRMTDSTIMNTTLSSPNDSSAWTPLVSNRSNVSRQDMQQKKMTNSKKSFSEIYQEACRFAVPPIQSPSKPLLARLACNETHLQLGSLGKLCTTTLSICHAILRCVNSISLCILTDKSTKTLVFLFCCSLFSCSIRTWTCWFHGNAGAVAIADAHDTGL